MKTLYTPSFTMKEVGFSTEKTAFVFEMIPSGRKGDKKKDCQLLEAAPEMLTACRLALKSCTDKKTQSLLNQVIKKAEGKI